RPGPEGAAAWRAEPAQVVIELGVLRDCCIAAACDPNAGDAIGELRLLQRAMDAITASVVEQHERERERARPALEQLATAALESTSLDDLLHHLVAVLLDITSTVDTAAILLVEGNRL